MVSLSLALVVCLALSIDVADTIKRVVLTVVVREHAPVGIFLPDERYGYVLRPNSKDRLPQGIGCRSPSSPPC